jgi:hypothetical protein
VGNGDGDGRDLADASQGASNAVLESPRTHGEMMGNKSEADLSVEDAAVECTGIVFPEEARRIELKRKFDLLKIKDTIKKPILHSGKMYLIIDTNVCYYYQEA